MYRYLLDTNIVLFFLFSSKELEREVLDLLTDYNNRLYVSTASIQEIIYLYKKDKIKTQWKNPEEILPGIDAVHFELLPIKREHLATYSRLSISKSHNDPVDHIIISQAITERITLISSDQKFEHYTNQKLDFIFNSR
ncbi:MAG: type II toxin-antitoxin system VapC family toxin [Candidatus Azobacteroides sp.]|nr:type II toxin-antitoxin system VapC family toxin [Candidatus Azobacteroides sp.]